VSACVKLKTCGASGELPAWALGVSMKWSNNSAALPMARWKVTLLRLHI
jgi:hypothetical protein